jgi:two-component system sensor histidine kinase YesM
MRCTVFLLYYIQKKRSVRKIKHGKISSVPEQKKGGNIMRISKQTKKTTLAQQGRYLLICLLSMLLLFLAGSVLILNRTQRQVYEQLEEISKLYTDELDNRFFRISRNLFSTVMDSSNPDSAFWKYMDLMEKDQYEEYVITQLRRNYVSAAWDFGTDYNVFLYTQKDDSLYQLSISSDGLYAVDPYLQEALKRRIKSLSQQTYAVKKKWTVMCQGDDVYMLKVAQSQGIGLGCYVNLKTILEPFSELSLGKSGYVSLVDQNGKSIGTLTEKGIVTDNSKINTDNYTFRQELSQAPFEIRIKISWTGVLNLMTGSVFALLGVAFLMVIAGSVLLFHLKTKILKPVAMFTENLQKYDNGDLTYQMSEGNLVELEQIDDKFRNMIHQIRRLKITLYEQELEKQKIEMDYLKIQIRPHFYMNCLNFIYSMIDFGQYDHAKSMSRITSDYLAYIFRNTSEMVPVTAETNHCENYLKILLLRYPEKFTYYFEVHEEVENAVIFPFLIQVFVENAAKHALTLETVPLISVTVYPEDRGDEKYVNIYISDTGNGFPEETLQRLKAGEDISEHGKHIGIENCLKRFRYYYGDSGEIHFDNSPLGGAIVDIHIPYRTGGEEHETIARG